MMPARKPAGEVSYLAQAVSHIEDFFALVSNKGKKLESVSTTIINENYYYTAPLYLGSNQELFNVLIDTGSSKLIIMDSSCAECLFTFDSSSSSTFVSSTTYDTNSYADGSYIRGYKVHDKVSLGDTTLNVPSFNFLLATTQHGFNEFGGLIGLTRTTDPSYTKYYNDLVTQGSTAASLFSIYMDDTGATSTM
jgi:predicted SPOUT superfamily RNA methylase MTH1